VILRWVYPAGRTLLVHFAENAQAVHFLEGAQAGRFPEYAQVNVFVLRCDARSPDHFLSVFRISQLLNPRK
jgi:hypothetical protein